MANALQAGQQAQQRRRGGPVTAQRGYAGAKATQRFLTAYAQDAATRAGLGITFAALLPKIAPSDTAELEEQP